MELISTGESTPLLLKWITVTMSDTQIAALELLCPLVTISLFAKQEVDLTMSERNEREREREIFTDSETFINAKSLPK